MIRSLSACFKRKQKEDDKMHVAAARSCGKCLFKAGKCSEKGMVCCVTVVDRLLKVLGPVLVLGGNGLIGFCTVTWFFYILPGYQWLLKIPLCIIGAFIAFNIFFNYYSACTMDAGKPPDPQQQQALFLDALELGNPGQDDGLERSTSFTVCGKCNLCKPARAHHCSVCKRCVLKMDHHCPWVNNCVGFGNYRFFVLFMFWLEIGCFFFVVTAMSDFVQTIWGRPQYKMPPPGHYHRAVPDGPFNPNSEGNPELFDANHPYLIHDAIGSRGRQWILFGTIMAISIGIALGILLGLHIFLVFSNQTTIEFQQSFTKSARLQARGESYRNIYDLGRTRNFQSVFGPYSIRSLRWALPSREVYGNGLEFPTIGSGIMPNE